ncbi:MAG: hypothetical protein NPIRA04_29060 [Nitrospirales bacterium]|nr:MAG: hypothetical protein NPIRA04_29060 [Nitrospirales bacterium]
MRKRVHYWQTEAQVECYDCRASYTLVYGGNGQGEWRPHYYEVKYGNKICEKKSFFWPKEMEKGRCWICQDCKGRNTFDLGICYEPEGSWNESS